MLLRSLELQGFKTFPDKTKLTFDKGITSVVGPNGSGKSNISDAIRWVLGEQSAKALRCSRMEDVVFNGTDKRKRQGYAEVTLTIDNSDRRLPYGGDDVAVTRRYYRSGESEYLINKAAVRLKDIHELFMDTGDIVFVMEDIVLGNGDISALFGDLYLISAGLLLRLRDIVTELESRIEPLLEQSEKAEQFLAFSEEKRGLEIALWLDTLNKSSKVLRDHEDKIAVAKAQYDEADEVLSGISAETEEIYSKNGMIASQIEEVRAQSGAYEVQIAEKRADISVAENDILHNKDNITRIRRDRESGEFHHRYQEHRRRKARPHR